MCVCVCVCVYVHALNFYYILFIQINFGVSLFFIDSFATAIVVSALNLILPALFELVAKIEKFKTRSGEVTITLLRYND